MKTLRLLIFLLLMPLPAYAYLTPGSLKQEGGGGSGPTNVLNVLASPYSCAGNGVTDDYACAQQAIWDASTGGVPFGSCTTGVHKTVYFPKPSVCYMHSQPYRVTCSNMEIKGDYLSPLCQNYTGDAIIEGASGTGKLPFTSALVGTGNALISTAGQQSESIDLARMLDGRSNLFNLNNWFANGFNISFYYKITGACGNAILSSTPAYPGTGNGAFSFALDGSCDLIGKVNTVSGGLLTIGTCGPSTLDTVYEAEIDWDGTTYRLWQGTPGGTAVSCGTSSSSNRMTQGIFEEIMLPDGAPHQYWPDGSSNQSNAFAGAIDSIRFEQASVHTSAYTVPNAKSTEDSNTVLLENWPASPDGSQIALINASADFGNLYTPVLDLSAAQTSNINIHDLELCAGTSTAGRPDGLFADAVNGARWTNLSCSAAYYSQFDAFQNDYYSNLVNWTGFGGHIGLNLGGAWNDSVTSNAQIDGVDGAGVVNQGGGGAYHTDDTTRITDRGALTYGWINNSSSGLYKDPYIDQEVGNTAFVASLLQNQPVNSTIVQGGVLSPGSNGVYVQQDNAGTGTTFEGTIFQTFGSPSEIIDYTNGTPTHPTFLTQTVNPIGIPISNNLSYVVHGLGCRGDVTLAAGAGVFSSLCIFPKDTCNGQDTTTAANTFVLAAPSAGRTFTDGVENSSTTLTSATAAFVAGDVGRLVVGSGIPSGTTIASVTNGTTVVLSAAATATATGVRITLAASVNIASGTGTDVIAVNCN